MEKSPAQYKLVQQISALNPQFMTHNSPEASTRFHDVLLLLMEAKWLTDKECDQAFYQFYSLCTERHKLEQYSSGENVDACYHVLLSISAKFGEMWKTVRLCLLLSHGQASIERGFSVNKEVLQTNIGTDTTVALRTVHQAIRTAGGVTSVTIMKELLQSCIHARRRYVQYSS